MSVRSRAARAVLLATVCVAGCDVSVNKPSGQVTLVGRVFSASLGQPVADVEVRAPDGTVVKTDKEGRFTLRHDVDKEGPVETKRDDYAPVSKDAPRGDGYVELFVKEVDGSKDIDAAQGGKAEGKGGASVSVSKNSLVHEDGKPANKARIEVASVDPGKPTDLPALPGNFDAKSGAKRGKISTESPVYVRARDGDKELSLGEGKSAEADMPVRRADASSEGALFRFDVADQTWVFVKTVPRVGKESGKPIPNAQVDPGAPVYRAELDQLGYWAVGEFFDALTCVHACVVDEDGKGVPFARAVATGVDHFTQLTTYADDSGCFALDVRAKAQISLAVQAIDGFVAPRVIETADNENTVAGGIDGCMDLGELKLETSESSSCPLGLRSCGNACVDTRRDPGNCGACDNECGGSTGRELSCVDGLCACPLGQRTCTGDGESLDAVPTPGGQDSTGTEDAGSAGAGGSLDAGVPDSAPRAGDVTMRAPDGWVSAQTAGYCAAPRTDDRNCGGCGIVCATGTRCVDGACGGGENRPDGGVVQGPDGGTRSDAGAGKPDAGTVDIGTAELTVQATLAFGPVLISQSSQPSRLTITNMGSGPATGCSPPILSGAHAPDFAIVDDTCGTADLGPLASCSVDIVVTPSTAGERTATLSRTCAQGGTVSTNPEGLFVNRPHYLFVTSIDYDGNLGGLAGADALCAMHAAAGSASGPLNLRWRALLSVSGTVDMRDRVVWTGPVFDVRNLLATNLPTTWPWPINGTDPGTGADLLSADENGDTTGSYGWTGGNASGIATGVDCNGWTTAVGLQGRAGENQSFTAAPGTAWFDSFSSNCSDKFYALRCISDGPAP